MPICRLSESSSTRVSRQTIGPSAVEPEAGAAERADRARAPCRTAREGRPSSCPRRRAASRAGSSAPRCRRGTPSPPASDARSSAAPTRPARSRARAARARDRGPAPARRDRRSRGARGSPASAHVERAQQRNGDGGRRLAAIVVAIAGRHVDASRPEEPEVVVVAQRLHREPAAAGEAADGEQRARARVVLLADARDRVQA